MSNDINFELTVKKVEFDLIILLMLHDACHDFDNDKSSVAFKELFLLNKAKGRLSQVSRSLSTGNPAPSIGGSGSTAAEMGDGCITDGSDLPAERVDYYEYLLNYGFI